ncbi:hypothetical protein Bbelb_391040 [Branchiostoma belcheri]|nr:hypothetical protein Bbelb_430240 [Branchiostoma belcheri]KAI8483222.1 hypothetical protein Bbelb_391040 [Branchiostoma belcheri]
MLNSHLWILEAVTCTAATPRATALAGRLNQVRVAGRTTKRPVNQGGPIRLQLLSSFLAPPRWDMSIPACKDWTRRIERGRPGKVQRSRRRGKAVQASWPSTAAKDVSGRDGFSVPPDTGIQGRESGIVTVQRLYHFNQLPHRSLRATPQLKKTCGDRQGAKQQVEVTTGSCSLDPAQRRPDENSHSLSDSGATEEFGVLSGD